VRCPAPITPACTTTYGHLQPWQLLDVPAQYCFIDRVGGWLFALSALPARQGPAELLSSSPTPQPLLNPACVSTYMQLEPWQLSPSLADNPPPPRCRVYIHITYMHLQPWQLLCISCQCSLDSVCGLPCQRCHQ
jgi:hypothetical protein